VDAGPKGGGQALRLGGSIWRFWDRRGYLAEGSAWLDEALSIGGGGPERALGLTGAGRLAIHRGEDRRATELLEQSLHLYQGLEDKAGTCSVLGDLGYVELSRGDFDRAEGLLAEALRLATDLGDKRAMARHGNDLGEVARHRGEYERAAALYEESVAIYGEQGHLLNYAMATTNLGAVELVRHDHQSAVARFKEALRSLRSLANPHATAMVLAYLAAATDNDPERAVRLWAASQGMLDAVGGVLEALDKVTIEPHLEAMRSRLDHADFQSLWSEGGAMDLAGAIGYALDDTDS
jgi:tetratricopeptide (TPR) repeat protein